MAMQFDQSALSILDRRRDRLKALGMSREWLAELPALLRWILSVPTLNAYVKQIVGMHDAADAALDRDVRTGIDRHDALMTEVDGFPEILPPLPVRYEDGSRPARVFESALESARLAKASDDRWRNVRQAAAVLEDRADSLWRNAVAANRQAEVEAVIDRANAGARVLMHRIDMHSAEHETSPRTALVELVDIVRALEQPIDEAPHWTDFLPRDRFKPYIDKKRMEEAFQGAARNFIEPIQHALDRFIEELHVLGASTLSHRVLVERFKERCTWYDKARMRDVARRGKGSREDRLTLELAKYLHDNGLFVLVRPRMSNLEPDVVGLRGLAVEAKAHGKSTRARRDIIRGYYQLHSYMTSLETGALRVSEGFLVVFRLDGAIYETPPTLNTGRFTIHSMTIDLGVGATSGRRQPPTKKIEEGEIFNALA